jgi:hypothetical protein
MRVTRVDTPDNRDTKHLNTSAEDIVPALGRRLLVVFTPFALLFSLVSCTPFRTGLGDDPCLLLQYQTRSFTAVHEMRRVVDTLRSQVDALKGPISSHQDVFETLAALTVFKADIHTQWNLLQAGPHPLEGRAFDRGTRSAVSAFGTAVTLLTQAYLAYRHHHAGLANELAGGGRAWMRRGRVQLALAAENLATLHTFSPNC